MINEDQFIFTIEMLSKFALENEYIANEYIAIDYTMRIIFNIFKIGLLPLNKTRGR